MYAHDTDASTSNTHTHTHTPLYFSSSFQEDIAVIASMKDEHGKEIVLTWSNLQTSWSRLHRYLL